MSTDAKPETVSRLATEAAAEQSFFRPEAIQHYLNRADRAVVLRVAPPWTWILVLGIVVFILTAVTFGIVGRVEITDRTRGVIRPLAGVRSLRAPAEGVVEEVRVRAGDLVPPGGLVFRLRVVTTESSVRDAETRLKLAMDLARHTAELEDRSHEEQVTALKNRLRILDLAVTSLRQSLERSEKALSMQRSLRTAGVTSDAAVLQAEDALDRARRDLGMTLQQVEQARQELSTIELRHASAAEQRRNELERGRSEIEGQRLWVEHTLVRAPIAGWVESLLVHEGDTVPAGSEVARLVPAQGAVHVVTFVPERDRRFMTPGQTALLEFDQFPYQDYGTVPARITRVGQEVATLVEIRQALGESFVPQSPMFRVELSIAEPRPELRGKLQSGTQVTVRFTLRRIRPIAFVADRILRGRSTP